MTTQPKRYRIALLGATGFVGQALCQRLRADGHRLLVLTRNEKRHADMQAGADLALVQGDIQSQKFITEHLQDCDVAINLVGIFNERGHSGREFRALHTELPRSFARACRAAGVHRVLHMSALGAQAGSAPSRYLRSKGEGANALQVELGSKVAWTIFSPSIIFGPGDSFTNRFASLLRALPVFPLACPQSRFAPVYIDDVVEAFTRSIDREDTHRKRYQLCGPRDYSLLEIVEYIAATNGRRRRIIPLSDRLSRWQANTMEYVPGKPWSKDNYLSLQIDSTADADDGAPGLAALDITPTPMEAVVPAYLAPDKP